MYLRILHKYIIPSWWRVVPVMINPRLSPPPPALARLLKLSCHDPIPAVVGGGGGGSGERMSCNNP